MAETTLQDRLVEAAKTMDATAEPYRMIVMQGGIKLIMVTRIETKGYEFERFIGWNTIMEARVNPLNTALRDIQSEKKNLEETLSL